MERKVSNHSSKRACPFCITFAVQHKPCRETANMWRKENATFWQNTMSGDKTNAMHHSKHTAITWWWQHHFVDYFLQQGKGSCQKQIIDWIIASESVRSPHPNQEIFNYHTGFYIIEAWIWSNQSNCKQTSMYPSNQSFKMSWMVKNLLKYIRKTGNKAVI